MRRPARRCSRSSTRPRRWSRDCRSTRHFSTSAASGGCQARPPRSRRGCGATCSSGSAWPSPSGWRGPSSWPRSPAAWPSRTGCSSSRPTASWRSSIRSRSNGFGASGRSRAAKLHDRGITTVGEVAALAEAVLVSMLGQAAGRHLHALAHNRDPRPVQVGRRRHSIGSQHALGRSPTSPDAVDAVVVGLVDRVTRRMRAAGRVGRTVVVRLRFADFSRATRSHTLQRATAHTQTILTTVRWLMRPGDADDRTTRPHPRRGGGRRPRRRRRRPAGVAARSIQRCQRSMPPSTGCMTGSDRLPSPAPCCSAATRAFRCRCSPTEPWRDCEDSPASGG